MHFGFRKIFKTGIHQFQVNPTMVWGNGLLVLLLLLLMIYVKLRSNGSVVIILFDSPFSSRYPYFGLLTQVANLLLCLAASICAFSVALLKLFDPKRHPRLILCSALLIASIMLDRVFRITILLSVWGTTTKVVMFLLYGLAILSYALAFRRQLLATPYLQLLFAASLLVMGGLADMLLPHENGTKAMLEDGSTLIATLNIALYFWWVCQKEVVTAFHHRLAKRDHPLIRESQA